MTSTYDSKGYSFDRFTDSLLADRDGPLPVRTYSTTFHAPREPWTPQSSIWNTMSNTSAYSLGNDRRGVFQSGNGRTAKATEAARPGTHKPNTNTINRIQSLRPAAISSSRTLEAPNTSTKPKLNGVLGADANTAMTDLDKSSLLSGSAPDIDPRSPSSSIFAAHRTSTAATSLDQFDLRRIREFVPHNPQDQTNISAWIRGSFGDPASYPTNEQSEWSYNTTTNAHNLPASPSYDQYPRAIADSTYASYKGYGHDGRGDSHAMSPSQSSWYPTSGFDNMHLSENASARNTRSRLRPDVAAYQPAGHHYKDEASNVLDTPGIEYSGELSGIYNSWNPVNRLPSAANSNAFTRNGSLRSEHTSEFQARPHYTSQSTASTVDAVTNTHTATIDPPSSHAVLYDGQNANHNLRQLDRKQPPYQLVFPEQVQIPRTQYDFAHLNLESTEYNGPSFQMVMGGPRPVLIDATTREALLGSEPPKSALLSSFLLEGKFLKQSPEKHPWPLKAIKNHVVEFCGDQLASRWIQAKMDQATSEDKDMLWAEIVTNARQLMSDNYANYVMQKMFDFCTQAQKRTLAGFMKGHMHYLSQNQFGCRVVQKAFEHILADQQATLVKELKGRVIETVENAHGNHVIQKAIECIHGDHIQFIVDAHKGEVVRLAKHTFGCRVIQRMLEHCEAEAKRPILDELHLAVPTLIDNSFGNYVIQNIIIKGDLEDKRKVIACVQKELLYYSTHKFASNVVEKALEHAEEEQRRQMLYVLTSPDRKNLMQTPVPSLIKDQFGNYVMQTVLKQMQGPARAELTEEIRRHLYTLGISGYTKQVMAMNKALNDVSCAPSPSSTSTGPSTPATPTGPDSGNTHTMPTKDVVEATSIVRGAPDHEEPPFC